MFRRPRRIVVATAVASLALATLSPTSAWAQQGAPPDQRFYNTAKNYADTMVLSGRDRYGSVQSGMFAVTLDRTTLSLPTTTPPAIEGVRGSDRILYGSNLMHDQQLHQLLYALSGHTGQPSYAQAADASLDFAFRNTLSPNTKLMACGEHLGWDFRNETRLATTPTATHEFGESWELWAKVYAVAPQQASSFAKGLWDNQVHSKTTGLFNRHADYDTRGSYTGSEFPRHGGYYIDVWSETYARTTDATLKAEMSTAVDVLTTSFLNRRKPNGALVVGTEAQYQNVYWSENNLQLAVQIDRSAPRMPSSVATKMTTLRNSIDSVFLSLPHELNAGGRGWVTTAFADTLTPGDPRGGSNPEWSSKWRGAYGAFTDAAMALLALDRYEVLPDGTARSQYRGLFLQAAERYMSGAPDTGITLYPGTLADVIGTMLGAYGLTQDPGYLQRAAYYGDWSLGTYFDATSALPKATNLHGHYEAGTGGDDLALRLLELYQAQQAAVPEPASAGVVLSAVLAGLGRRRFARQARPRV